MKSLWAYDIRCIIVLLCNLNLMTNVRGVDAQMEPCIILDRFRLPISIDKYGGKSTSTGVSIARVKCTKQPCPHECFSSYAGVGSELCVFA